jgi:glycosyltransferase involved in cell wall biosynthesis
MSTRPMIHELRFRTPGPPAAREIAILIPCYNEEPTIARVIAEFRAEAPEATIYVVDNNSTDRSAEIARSMGAVVLRETRQGKGYVVQKMFREIEADIYIMVDGDGTYPASGLRRLLQPVLDDEADMVVGSRLSRLSRSRFKALNRIGNLLFVTITNRLLHARVEDMLSGYRVFTRRLVKELPLFSSGFEIETELTIKALERGYRVVELPIDLGARPSGSFSKIRLAHDGAVIVNMIVALVRDYKPLTLFGALGLLLLAAGLATGAPVIVQYMRTGLVPHLPSTVISVGLVLAALIAATAGIVLHTIVRRFQELDFQLRLLSDRIGTSFVPAIAQRAAAVATEIEKRPA